LLSTCPALRLPPLHSIREKAELKLYSALGRQAKRKRQHMGDLKIVVAGCAAAAAAAAAAVAALPARCCWS